MPRESITDELSRRNHLQLLGSAAVTAGLAGCMGDGNGDDDGTSTTEFTVGEIIGESNGCFDCVMPTPNWRLPPMLEDRSDGDVIMNLQPESQICDTSDCGSSAQGNVIQSGYASVGNSTAFFPENQIHLIPYLYPSRRSLSHTLFHPEVWENYWVPFAEKYNIFPFYTWTPDLRQVFVSESGTEAMGGEDLRRPEQLEGLSIRRTESRVAQESLATWNADPVELTWGDTIQGMETGVVDGLETWSSVALGFGMGEVIDQVVNLDWKCGVGTQWVNTDWLRSLPEDHLEIIADATKQVTEEGVHIAQETIEERVGEQDPVPEGSAWDELGVNVNILNEEEAWEWQRQVDPIENPDMWNPEKELMGQLGVGWADGEETFEALYDIAREDAVPNTDGDFEIQSWWDDWLHELS